MDATFNVLLTEKELIHIICALDKHAELYKDSFFSNVFNLGKTWKDKCDEIENLQKKLSSLKGE